MEISPPAIEIIQEEELFKDTAYDDKRPDYVLQPGDKILGTLTIGYGHTNAARDNDEEIQIGDTVTEEEAKEILKLDIAEFEKYVTNRAKKFDVELTQSQYDALVMASMNRDNKMSGGPLWRAIKSGDENKIRELWSKTIEASVKAFPGLEDRKNEDLDMFFGTYNTPDIAEEIVKKEIPSDAVDPERLYLPSIDTQGNAIDPDTGNIIQPPKQDNTEMNMMLSKMYSNLSNSLAPYARTKTETQRFGRNAITVKPQTDSDKPVKVEYDSDVKQNINDIMTKILSNISEAFGVK